MSWVAYELRGLSRPGVFSEPVDGAAYLLPNRTVKPLEGLSGLVAEDDLVHHWLKASLSLDLIPWDKRFACFDAGASLTS